MSFCSGSGQNGATPAFGGGAASGATPAAATGSNSFSSSPGSPNPGPGIPLKPDGATPTSMNVDPGSINAQSLLDKFIQAKTAINGMSGGGPVPTAGFAGNMPLQQGSAGMATPGAQFTPLKDPATNAVKGGGNGVASGMMSSASKTGSL